MKMPNHRGANQFEVTNYSNFPKFVLKLMPYVRHHHGRIRLQSSFGNFNP